MAQHKEIENKTYNERLFNPGLRGFFHNARFKWLYNSFLKRKISSGKILEIGCNDGRSLKYLPFKPEKYVGYDADWEGGFEEAIENYSSWNNCQFIKSDNPISFNTQNEKFDYSLAMETLEHLPLIYLNDYLKKLSSATNLYGFYSVPNERGLVFFLKYFFKKLFIVQREPYSNKEIWYALLGRLDKVKRNDTSHKGFDYKKLIIELEKYFDVEEVNGIPFSFLPVSLNFTIGIVVKKKSKTF